MKLLMKLTLVAAVVAIGTGAALADDQHLQERLTALQAQNAPHTTSVAVYANHQGVGRAGLMANQKATASEPSHYEFHLNGHGTPIGN